ncbi:hypothetical protein NBG4_890003 [Candidatus Sulfobium mesophilum]|uniref:Uncharacterized protein n=1 Tax=Candidatus Sulfobium mesophilum TaxID=2016548 RepID=A0A2U3QL12_9BACT|nr:hypothetical protein NBG4_890003 [Candidatus Sulfobium mesophilum]
MAKDLKPKSIEAQKMQISINLDKGLREKLDRLPRGIKLATFLRLVVRTIVSTPAEMSEWCKENEDEALASQALIVETFQKLETLSKPAEAKTDDK